MGSCPSLYLLFRDRTRGHPFPLRLPTRPEVEGGTNNHVGQNGKRRKVETMSSKDPGGGCILMNGEIRNRLSAEDVLGLSFGRDYSLNSVHLLSMSMDPLGSAFGTPPTHMFSHTTPDGVWGHPLMCMTLFIINLQPSCYLPL